MRIGRALTADGVHFCQPEEDGIRLLDGGFDGGFRPGDRLVPGGRFRLLSPVRPGKVLVVLGAFPKEGSKEEARRIPPRFAAKLSSTVVAPGDEVVVPSEIGDAVTIEPELAVVIGSPIRRATPGDVSEAILGYTCMNDVTHLPFIREQGDFLRAKSPDTFGPLGPWVETGVSEDDVGGGLEIRAVVDDELVPGGNTRHFTHRVAEVVSEASRYYTLEPGDVISLGTPPEPVTARVGQVMRIEVEGVGSLENPLVREA